MPGSCYLRPCSDPDCSVCSVCARFPLSTRLMAEQRAKRMERDINPKNLRKADTRDGRRTLFAARDKTT